MPKVIEEVHFEHGSFQVYNSKPDLNLLEVNQVHGNDIVDASKELSACDADGMKQSYESNNILAIKTADCVPVLFLSKNDMALVHIGWRGLHSKIHLNQLITNMNPHYAYIGPHISQKHYEVGKEFLTYFSKDSIIDSSGKYYFSLKKELIAQLNSYYKNISIELSSLCTFNEDNLNSYRRDKTDKRNWNIYIPNRRKS